MPKKPLPEKVVKEMHRFRKDGHTLKDIGEAFGMKIRGKGYSAQHIKKLFEKHKLSDTLRPSKQIKPRINLDNI